MYVFFMVVAWFFLYAWVSGEFSNDDLAGY